MPDCYEYNENPQCGVNSQKALEDFDHLNCCPVRQGTPISVPERRKTPVSVADPLSLGKALASDGGSDDFLIGGLARSRAQYRKVEESLQH